MQAAARLSRLATMEVLPTIIGMAVVGWMALHRFSQPISLQSFSADKPERITDTIIRWFKVDRETPEALFSPIRANTTRFKFWLYASLYSIILLIFYIAVINIPDVLDAITSILEVIEILSEKIQGSEFIAILIKKLDSANPIIVAFLVLLLLWFVPPFSGIERDIRRALFRRAAIPAKLLRDRNRLAQAKYEPPRESDSLIESLVAEGFLRDDLIYEEDHPTAQSLWMKTSLLMREIQRWSAEDKYQRAYASLMDAGERTRSADTVERVWSSLKGDARTCFREMRTAPVAPETEERVDAFRKTCGELLDQIYYLFARISLFSHYSEAERAKSLRSVGFDLRAQETPLLPDANDLLWFLVSVVTTVGLFAAPFVGWINGLGIVAILFTAIMIPMVLLREFPGLRTPDTSVAPPILFPAISGLLAAMFGFFITMIVLSLENSITMQQAWSTYQTKRMYELEVVHALTGILVAYRIGVGRYPYASETRGFKVYQRWGSLRDAFLFAFVIGISQFIFLFLNIAVLDNDMNLTYFFFQTNAVLINSAVIGFIVPTCYRATVARTSAINGQS